MYSGLFYDPVLFSVPSEQVVRIVLKIYGKVYILSALFNQSVLSTNTVERRRVLRAVVVYFANLYSEDCTLCNRGGGGVGANGVTRTKSFALSGSQLATAQAEHSL